MEDCNGSTLSAQASASNTQWNMIPDDSYTLTPATLEESREQMTEFLEEYVGPDATVVDLGCGKGPMLQSLSEIADSVIGLEASESFYKVAEKEAGGYDNVEAVHCDAYNWLKERGEPVDAITAINVLHEGTEERGLEENLKTVAEALEEGGVLTATIPSPVEEEGGGPFKIHEDEDGQLYTPGFADGWRQTYHDRDEVEQLAAEYGLERVEYEEVPVDISSLPAIVEADENNEITTITNEEAKAMAAAQQNNDGFEAPTVPAYYFRKTGGSGEATAP